MQFKERRRLAADPLGVGMTTQARSYHYEFRVDRHVGTAVTAHFPDFAVILNADATTTLSGIVADQAALHGVLARIRDLGLTLLAVNRVAAPVTEQPIEEYNHV